MILIRTINELKKYLNNKSETIGFVPTMGALHPGHLSLIAASKQTAPFTICSIFVNPTQFNDPADYQQYPITIESDIQQLESAGCDLLFLPSVQEIYPDQTQQPHFALGHLENLLEGAYRPGHFQGVCQVVSRLLQIIQPTWLFLGQKDYQQCMVIAKLIELEGLSTQLTIVPTMREPSGLAMSSRNMRLTEQGRAHATAIYTALKAIKENIKAGPVSDLQTKAIDSLLQAGFSKVDYVSIAHATTLEPVLKWDGQESLVVLAAAFIEGVRLIDNMPLNTSN